MKNISSRIGRDHLIGAKRILLIHAEDIYYALWENIILKSKGSRIEVKPGKNISGSLSGHYRRYFMRGIFIGEKREGSFRLVGLTSLILSILERLK